MASPGPGGHKGLSYWGSELHFSRPLSRMDPGGRSVPFGVLMGCAPSVLQAEQLSASHQVCEDFYSPAWDVGEAR